LESPDLSLVFQTVSADESQSKTNASKLVKEKASTLRWSASSV